MVREHDIVALLRDRPADDLRAGDVGAVVHCYSEAKAFEVEFVDERGVSKCVVTLDSTEIMRLNLLSLSA